MFGTKKDKDQNCKVMWFMLFPWYMWVKVDR